MEVALSYFHWLFLGNIRTTPAFFFPNSWVIQQGLGDVSRGTFPGLATGVRDIVRIPTASPSSHGSHYFIRAPLIISLIIIMEGQERQQRVKLENSRAKGLVPDLLQVFPLPHHSHRDMALYSQGMDGHGHIPISNTAAKENMELENP